MPKNNQNGFAGIFWLAISLSFVGLLVWLFSIKPAPQTKLTQPTVSATNTELKYSDQNLNLRFSYPSKYKLVEDNEQTFIKRGNTDFRKNFTSYVGYAPPDPISAITLQDPGLLERDSFDKAPFLIWVFDNPDDLSGKDWYERYWYYPFMWGVFTFSQKSQSAPKLENLVSGQLAWKGAVSYQEGSPEYIYLSSNKKMYLIRILATLDSLSKDEILQSLKLLIF